MVRIFCGKILKNLNFKMKNKVLLIVFFIIATTPIFGQFNPEKPDLCQRSFYTETQAVEVHQATSKLYSDKTSWEKRAVLIKKGILDGAEIKKISHKKPKNIVINSKKVLNGYAVENVSFESMEGIYVTGNLYTPLSMSGKSAAILCPHGHGSDPRYKEYTQQRCATLALKVGCPRVKKKSFIFLYCEVQKKKDLYVKKTQ